MLVIVEDRFIVGREYFFIAVRSSNVLELYVIIFEGGGEGEVVSDVELDVSYIFRLVCGSYIMEGEGEGVSL